MKGVKENAMDLFDMLLLSSRKVEHFVCVFYEDSALGLGLRNVERGSEDGHFGCGDLFDDPLRFPTEYHALHHTASGEVSSHYFNDADVVHVEVLWIAGHDREGSFCDKRRKGVFEPILF